MAKRSGITRRRENRLIRAALKRSGDKIKEDFPPEVRRRLFMADQAEAWPVKWAKRYRALVDKEGKHPREAYLIVQKARGVDPWPADLAPPPCEKAQVVEGVALAKSHPEGVLPICDACGWPMIRVPAAREVNGPRFVTFRCPEYANADPLPTPDI